MCCCEQETELIDVHRDKQESSFDEWLNVLLWTGDGVDWRTQRQTRIKFWWVTECVVVNRRRSWLTYTETNKNQVLMSDWMCCCEQETELTEVHRDKQESSFDEWLNVLLWTGDGVDWRTQRQTRICQQFEFTTHTTNFTRWDKLHFTAVLLAD